MSDDPAATSSERKWRQRLLAILAGASSGLLAGLAFPLAGQSWLAFFALVPLIAYLRATRGRRAILAVAAFALPYYSIGLFWLAAVVTPVGPILLSLVFAVIYHVPIGFVIGRLLRKGYPVLLVLPLLWAAGEFVKSWLYTGFAWLYLAHTQAEQVTLIQVSDVFGAYGLTAILVLVSTALVEVGFAVRARGLNRAALPAGLTVLVLAGALVYGALRRPAVEVRDGPKVLLVQGNIPQLMKNEAFRPAGAPAEVAPPSSRTMMGRYLALTKLGLEAHPDAVAVIWPETMFPYDISDIPADRREREAVESLLRGAFSRIMGNRPAIIGAVYRSPSGERRNSAFLIDERGEIVSRYDKVHAVTGGEYIPFRTVAPDSLVRKVGEMIRDAAGFTPDLVEGEDLVEFEAAGLRLWPLICYEITYPELARDATRRGADVLLNITNYGWFPDTSEPEQATQMAVFRAVENRRPVVVAANTGLTVVVSPRGEVLEGGATWYPEHARFSAPERLGTPVRNEGRLPKEIPGFVARSVPLSGSGSLYGFWGDFPWILVLVLAITGLVLRAPTAFGARGDGRNG